MAARPYYRGAVPHSGARFRTHRAQPTAPKTIGAEVCKSDGCGQLILPDVDYSTGFRRETWPEKCHRCGAPFAQSEDK